MYSQGGGGIGNSCAFIFGSDSAPDFTVDGLRAHNVWDGIRPRAGTMNWRVQNCWISYLRDDAVENDHMYSGTIDDCLFDGVFVGLSCRDKSTDDHSNEVVTMQNSLMRLAILPGPGGKDWYEPADGHMGFTKWNGYAPKLSLKNNIFMLEQLPWNGVGGLEFPQGNANKLHESENNIIVWLGQGDYPGIIQRGFTVVTDRAVWDNAKAAWIAAHPKVARFPFDPPATGVAIRLAPAGIHDGKVDMHESVLSSLVDIRGRLVNINGKGTKDLKSGIHFTIRKSNSSRILSKVILKK